MVFPVVGGDGKPTGYEIDNSLRFWNGDYLKDTTFGAGTNRKKFTFSYWIKPTNLDTGGNPSLVYSNDSNDHIGFDGDNKFIFADSGSIILKTNRVFRDVSAWYHIVLAVDTTQSTAGNRYKLYVNGTQETSLATDAGISQNTDLNFHNNEVHSIGRNQYDGTDFLYAYLAEFHAIDGQQLDPTYFGETNDNGVWIPKEYTGTYGNNGIFMEFKQSGTGQSSSSMGADTSGNDNHFTTIAVDATNQTTDTPTNNFATWNPLDPNRDNDLGEGNTQYVSPTSAREQIRSTFGLTSGKWYWETKPTTANGGLSVGVLKENASMTLDDSLGKDDYGWSYDSDGSSRHNNSSTSSGFDTYTTNDIIGVALDLDNHEIFFYKNGTAQNSGNKAFDLDTGETYFAACGSNSNGSTETLQVNFGNAPFSISSGNSDGAGHGNFEYAVPSGYFALCTKNLAQYG